MGTWARNIRVNYERTDLYVWERRILKYMKESGVYVFRDKNDKIIYIGEAGNLASRVEGHLSGKKFDSALYDDDGFTYTYKVELYRLKGKDSHKRFQMEIDGIQRLNPIFNRKYRIDGTKKSRKIERETYASNNKDITWKNWTLWQVEAFLEGNVLSDVVLRNIKKESGGTHPYSWGSVEKEELIERIRKRHSCTDKEEIINKAFMIGVGDIADYNVLSPITSRLLQPFLPGFKAKYTGIQKLINLLNDKKGVGEKLAPTPRREGDPHKDSPIQAF